MKKSLVFTALIAMVVLPFVISAQESVLPPNADKALIEKNLLVGLATPNLGLQRSCALMLGKIQAENAVIPLLDALHNNSDPNVRIAAAWALCRIGDARGTYAVKMAVRYDENSRVKASCAWYYENYVQEGTFTFSQPEYELIAQLSDK